MPQSGRATRNSRFHVNTGTDVRIIQGAPSSIIRHHPTTSGSSDSDSDDDNDDSSCSDSSSDSDSSTSTSSSDISSNCCDDDDNDDVINLQKKQDRYTKEVWLSARGLAIGLTCYFLVMFMVDVGVGVGLYFDQHPLTTDFFNCITFVSCIVMVKNILSDKNPLKKQDLSTIEVWLLAIGLTCSCLVMAGVGAASVVNCIAMVSMVNIQRDAIAKNSMSDKTD